VVVQINVQVQDLYNRTAVQSAVKAAIVSVFNYANVDFGMQISMGQVYKAAMAVDGVEYVTLSKMYLSDPTLTADSGLDINNNPADPGTIVTPIAGVRDIVTPARSIPRLSPTMITTDTWVTASGGLVNT